jgi:hypothetical protein
MSQSTPLTQLPRENMTNNQNQQSSSDMVDDILNEMSTTDEMNTESFNHVMDSSQVPPEKMEENFLNNSNNNSNQDNFSQENNSENDNKKNTIKEGLKETMMSKLKTGNMEELFKNCLKQIKYSIMVFVLVIIVSLPQFNRFIFTKVKGMLLESGEINMKGVVLKGVIATIVFLILSFVV